MATASTRSTASTSPADAALAEILGEIGVPRPVLKEAKTRRDLVLEIAMDHDAARDCYVSGSVAHGTHNRPLEDTDCGIMVNRRIEEFRQFGPDGDGRGPEEFIQVFADFVLPLLRERGYPNAELDLSGQPCDQVRVQRDSRDRRLGPGRPVCRSDRRPRSPGRWALDSQPRAAGVGPRRSQAPHLAADRAGWRGAAGPSRPPDQARQAGRQARWRHAGPDAGDVLVEPQRACARRGRR